MLLAAAILRLAFFEDLEKRMDEVFFVLVCAAVLAVVLPWERLTTFKAGGVEIALEQPRVVGALRSLGLDRVEDERLRDELARLEADIRDIDGSRVLWIDDRPQGVIGLRRMLRAFGVEIIMTTSTDAADELLRRDNDFDLLISDIQRRDEAEQSTFRWIAETHQDAETSSDREIRTTDGRRFVKLHEGVNYVVRLRTEPDRDPVVRSIPVLFYAAYEWTRLAKFAAVAMATSPDTEISNSPMTFVPRAIRMLASARAAPIPVPPRKGAT